MSRVDLDQAKDRLEELVEEAANGGDVVITRGDGATFKLVPALADEPRPRYGSAKGQIKMSEDFDAPLDDFAGYMPS
jgi:antitoxin (DNA-binding transcriptional repressor) of toxin-antitoxin stability system